MARKMKIGLIDVDGHNFPNIALMKISAWHKAKGDSVEWYYPLLSGHMDRVYMSKVFTFSPDYQYFIDADEVIKGGTGYFYPGGGEKLSPEIEHSYPDYGLYGITDTAFGFLSRGCPRGCNFCIVKDKEGRRSRKVADLREFWDGQKNINLLDPNIIACSEWADLLGQLEESKAWIDFSQGLDIRVMTEKKAEALRKLKIKTMHFAWDRYEEKDVVLPKLKMFKELTGIDRRKLAVYILCNYDTTHEQDLERIYAVRDLGYDPYVMIYNKQDTGSEDTVRRLQRWVNNRFIFNRVKRFEDYGKEKGDA